MICKKCFKENDNNNRFCVFCGNELNPVNSSVSPNANIHTISQKNSSPIMEYAKKQNLGIKTKIEEKKVKKIVVAIVSVFVAIVLLFAGIVFYGLHHKSINNYINDEITFSGYDGNGQTEYGKYSYYGVFDFEQLENELKMQITKKHGSFDFGTAYMLESDLRQSIDVKLDKTSDLCNGDIITATITVNYDIINAYKPKVKLTGDKIITKKYKVSGLTPLTEFNPFETVKDVAIFENNGKKEIVVVDPIKDPDLKDETDQLSWSFKDIDNPSNYSVGDKVTLEIGDYDEAYVNSLGYKFSKLSQEYTLCSLSPITNKNQLNEEAIEQVVNIAKDIIYTIEWQEVDFSNSSVYLCPGDENDDYSKLFVFYSVDGKYTNIYIGQLYISSNGNVCDEYSGGSWHREYFVQNTENDAINAVIQEGYKLIKVK